MTFRTVLGCILAWSLGGTTAWAQYATQHPRYPTCPAATAAAPADQPMNIRLDTSTGHRLLILHGNVAAGDAGRISQALSAYAPIDEIWMNSLGGDADEGNDIGRVIRRSGIPVHIPNDWWCVSACNFMFFGGLIRTIAPRGALAVHMATFNNATSQAQIEQGMAMLTADDVDAMLFFGISRDLLTDVMYRQSASGLRCLTRAEMRRYNVVNVD